MSREAVVQARVDARTKKMASAVLGSLGMTLSDAINSFLHQVVLHRGIPFEIKVPTELTMATLEKASRGEDVDDFESVEALFKDLGLGNKENPPVQKRRKKDGASRQKHAKTG
jgi:DNA-damage-inducible protein J